MIQKEEASLQILKCVCVKQITKKRKKLYEIQNLKIKLQRLQKQTDGEATGDLTADVTLPTL